MALRIENNKGFFEGAQLAQKEFSERKAEQEQDRRYLLDVQRNMSAENASVDALVATGAMSPQEAKARYDDIAKKHYPMINQAYNSSLWRKNVHGQWEKSNVALPRTTDKFNAELDLQGLLGPDGKLQQEHQNKGIAYNRMLGAYGYMNPNENPVRYDANGNPMTGSNAFLYNTWLNNYYNQ